MTKTDFDDKLKSLNQKINSNKTKHLFVEDELKKLQTLDSIYFRGKTHFKKMVHKIIYFSQGTDILRGLLILIIF